MNNLQEMSAPSKVEDLVEELLIDIKDLEPEPAFVQCCIYRVPKKIRSTNEKFYTPQLISIGPFHYGDKKLADMEEKKKRYMKQFLQRITSDNRDKILTFIKDNEHRIRNCYAEIFTLESHKFVMMIMYDAIFIIELFVRNKSRRNRASDSLLATAAGRHTLCKDLELLENQLPFFVLEEIYMLANLSGPQTPTFMELSCSFFSFFTNLKLATLPGKVEIKHFCTWRRITLLKGYPNSVLESKGWIKDLPSAVKLHESGVHFKRVDRECLLDIKFATVKRLIPFFRKHELQIPRLELYDNTEFQLRNIMALEQCCYTWDSPVCNYIKIMDSLINTEKDVDLLVAKGIISSQLGNHASVVHMFYKLNKNIHLSLSSSYKCCEDLKAHYNNRWNRRKATLRSVYFSSPWRGAGSLAAIVLLLFTVIQTVCSIMQV
ncbi:UPF0481 protein At3g47200-like [Pistacia vera]|uniref:UPF0481 protein At3g47200-like n=1 Tax=Pistacia vera TaxID=55513 RepID=UPI0012638233|nr:UPF0481 protein At3g47200-like [Pistacia vera]